MTVALCLVAAHPRTSVYVKALVEGWATERVGAARNELRRDFPRAMLPDAYAMLRRLDPAASARIHPNNYEAVINTLASLIGSNQQADRGHNQPVRSLALGLEPAAGPDARSAVRPLRA